jgi:fermentation-respiration switch protein FrsA (DUF1100 family)
MRASFARGLLLLVLPWPLLGCSLVFLPVRYPEGDWRTPGDRFEDAWFTAADGVRLHGWFAAAARPRAAVLYAHGNAGNITGLYPLLDLFREDLRASLLVFDYRGYGRSEGAPDEKGVLADARAARRWLAGRAGIAEKEVVLLGRSLGGGVAVQLAARDGARGLILENTFTSVPDVACRHAGLPVGWLFSTRLDSLALIHDYHGPLLQTHGDADRTVPFDLAETLFAAANEPKQFVRVKGGGHNAPPGRDYLHALDHFLAILPPVEPHRKALP